MNADYRKKLFDLLNQIDELAGGPVEKTNAGGMETEKGGEKKDAAQKAEAKITEESGDATVAGANHDIGKRYNKEFKKMIVKLHAEDGVPFRQITEKYGVSKASIVKWCSDSRYENCRKAAEATEKLESSKNDVAKLREENNFLRSVLVMLIGKSLEAEKAG